MITSWTSLTFLRSLTVRTIDFAIITEFLIQLLWNLHKSQNISYQPSWQDPWAIRRTSRLIDGTINTKSTPTKLLLTNWNLTNISKTNKSRYYDMVITTSIWWTSNSIVTDSWTNTLILQTIYKCNRTCLPKTCFYFTGTWISISNDQVLIITSFWRVLRTFLASICRYRLKSRITKPSINNLTQITSIIRFKISIITFIWKFSDVGATSHISPFFTYPLAQVIRLPQAPPVLSYFASMK